MDNDLEVCEGLLTDATQGSSCTAKSWRKDACLMLNCGDSHGATVLRMSGGACLHLLRLE